MSNHRNWRQIPKDELQRIVTAHDTGCENCARVAELEAYYNAVMEERTGLRAMKIELENTVRQLRAENAELKAVTAERDALLYEVDTKVPGESRYDTALRWLGEHRELCQNSGLSELLEGKE